MDISPALIQLMAILYGILVAAVITAPAAIWAKLTGVTKEQGVLQEQIAGIRLQLDDVKERIDQTNDRIDQTNERIDRTNERIDQTNERIDALRDDFREEMRRNTDDLREEMRRNADEMREEMRRNADRVMLALVNHSHQDGSPPVFSVPPEVEQVAADD